MRQIEYGDFVDKIHGCWYGKCLGGAAGAPVEGIKKIIDVNDFTDIYNPDLPNDDLDIQLLWLDVLERKGTVINSCDLADAWLEKCWYPFSEYGYFMKNYERGIKPPYSGIVNNSFFSEGMGCPIRSEIWAVISAGNHELAAQYAYIDACLDHSGNSIYAEQFLAAMESEAFFESDILKLIECGRKYVPNECSLGKCMDDVIRMYHEGSDWMTARHEVLKKYSHPDFTNVVQNMGFVLIALIYGDGDMRKTINIALKCGYDADCTCATAGAVIGIINGYNGLSSDVKNLINDYFIIGIDVKRPSDKISKLAEDTLAIAMRSPNYNLDVTNAPCEAERPIEFNGLKCEYPTDSGLDTALKSTEPVRWRLYGPYFEQLEQPIDKRYPSPHGEGSVLPDLVCMVNNSVSLEKNYIGGKENAEFIIESYDDFIDVDKYFTMNGQMCCYAKTYIDAPQDMQIWLIVGNNDGFSILLNDECILKKDEIRLWTPYNNFTLAKFHEGINEISIKLLRRTDKLKFSVGFRRYEGCHWHRSKWHTDLKFC